MRSFISDFVRWMRNKQLRFSKKASARDVLCWTQKDCQLYPQLSSPVAGKFVSRPNFGIDPTLVARIKTAYRLAMENFESAGTSPWAEYGARAQAIHNCLVAEDDEPLIQLLSDPIATNLFYGFYSLSQDLSIVTDSFEGRALRDWEAQQIFGCLVRLAEATGAIRLWNPEGTEAKPGEGYCSQAGIEKLLKALDDEIGIHVDFPNPFPNEFGLPSRRGIASYRAPQAIYQAWRVHQLMHSINGTNLLELGAGMGRTAYYAKCLGISNITLVDLPLANVAQAAFLGSALNPNAIWLPGDSNSEQAGRIRICPPKWLESVNENIDVVLNADSMPEMDKTHAIDYFCKISRRAKLFLSINHEAYPLRVRDLPLMSGIDVRATRHPYWMRNGYLEELFYMTQKP
jgi:hypothetical protein